MSEDRSFHGSPDADGTRDRRVALVVAVLIVGFVAVAIVKPWGDPMRPSPSLEPDNAEVTSPTPSLRSTGPPAPSASPAPSAVPARMVAPLPVAFTTPPPSEPGTWLGLRWRRLAPDDPLTLVTSVLRWRRGFAAIGWEGLPPKTPVWTSGDGRRWDPLPYATSTTFWPDQIVAGVAEVPAALAALTEAAQYCVEPCQLSFRQPVVAWTSSDGRAWAAHPLPDGWLPAAALRMPLFTSGPAGLLAASTGPAARLATSADGSHWRVLPGDAFPARFALNDLRGTPTGYVAVGHWMTNDGVGDAASLWSSDGRHWPGRPTLLPTSAPVGPVVGSVIGSLAVGHHGMVAIGRGVTSPGAVLWWQSSDGRRWSAMATYAPVGPTTCTGEGCGRQPNGTVVGDGQWLVALRSGAHPGAWVSSDGRSWRPLAVTGDVPDADANAATLLPSGVLLTDGPTTWLGEAILR